MGQFLRSLNDGGNLRLHMSLQIGTGALKKQQLTRRGGRQRGGGARGKDGGGGGGNICGATTLWKGSAACPPVCKAASCTTTHTNVHVHMGGDAQHINRQNLLSVTKG